MLGARERSVTHSIPVGRNPRILVVDDSLAIQDDFRKILGEQDSLQAAEARLFGKPEAGSFQIDYAQQGQEAFRLVQQALAESYPYAMAFVDVRMPPGWDGVETTRRIWEVYPDLQVVICTAYSDYSLNEISEILGHPDRLLILKKPFDTIEVVQLAHALTQKWRLLQESRRRTRNLEESEQRYRFLAEAMPQIIWTSTPEGNSDYFNQRWYDYTGMTFDQTRDWGWRPVLHPDDRQNCLEQWTRSCTTGCEYQVEFRLKRGADGAFRWHLALASPMRNVKGEVVHWVGTCTDIDDSKRAQELLREAHANLEERVALRTVELNEATVRLQGVLDAATQVSIIATDTAGLITVFNSGAEQMLGYHADEMLGQPMLPLVHLESEMDRRARELNGLLAQPLVTFDVFVELARRDNPGGRQWTYVRKSGSHLTVCLVVTALRDAAGSVIGFLAMANDVTERLKAEAAVREASSLWRVMLDSGDYTMIATTPDGIIRDFNAAAERLLGYTAADVVGKVTPATFHDSVEMVARARVLSEELGQQVAPDFEVLVIKARRGGSDENEWTYVRKDGGRVPVRLSVTAMYDGAGVVTGFLGIGTDITEHRRAREDLVRAKEAAEQAMRARSDFLARMSHEIRTPMNGVLGMTALALETVLSREQRGYIDTARSSAHSLLGIIDDILDFSKIDAGKLRLEHIPFRPREVCRESLSSLVGQANRKGLELLLDTAPDVPAGLIGDPQRLRQVITNLVANAVKFTDRGEVAVRVRVTDSNATQVRLEIEVSDTGIGIAADKQKAIFEAFTQADQAITRRFGGTGLGLAICSQLVGLMNGKVWVNSELGKGSRFGFSLSLDVDVAARPEPSAPAAVTGLPVLVVDDHPAQREIVVGLLNGWRMRATGTHPDAALEVAREARALGNLFRLLVLDGAMSGVDSHELGALLKAECAAGTPVVLLRSTGDSPTAEAPSPLGHYAVVMKPVGDSNFLETVQAILAGTTGPSASADFAIPRSSRSLRVLVAEDNAVNLKLAVTILEKAGHQVVAAVNGRQALTALARSKFDVVLMDVQMPEMDGLEATRTFRASESTAGGHVPIIALTAQAMKGDREACLAAGVDACLTKPFEIGELLAAIEAVTAPDAASEVVARPSMDSAALPFDEKALMDRIGNDADLLRELLAMFQASLPRLMEDLVGALESGDAQAMSRTAHSLTGSLLNVGANPAAAAARAIEKRARSGKMTGIEEQVSTLRGELVELQAALSTGVRPASEERA
jgi:PAS domain S-box-containing protein